MKMAVTAPGRVGARRRKPIVYPTSDGRPMAETPLHMQEMIDLIETLQDHFAADPDVYVWGSLRRWFPTKAKTDEYFLHMGNGAYGASGSPIFRCLPIFNAGKLLGVDVAAPSRVVGVFIRLNNEKDGLKYADRLRVEPKDMAWGIGGRQFYPYLVDYVKEHPCEALR